MANTADVTAVNSDMVFAVRELSGVTVSTLLSNCALLALMAIFSHQKPDEILGVGDPDASSVISGAKLDPAKIRQIEQCGSYSPLEESVRQSDFRRKTWRDTMATPSAVTAGTDATFTITVVGGVITAVTVANSPTTAYTGSGPTLVVIDSAGSCGFGAVLRATLSSGVINTVTVVNGGQGYTTPSILVNAGKSEGERYSRPVFKWCELEHVGAVYNRDIESAREMGRMAPSEEDGVMSVVSDSIRRELANQATQICDDLWYGSPTTQTDTIWDYPWGILNALSDSNIYAGLDRTVAANYWWKAKVDSAAHNFSFKELVDDANLNKGISYKGGPIDVFLVNPTLHAKYKAESVAYSQDINIKEELKEMGKIGFKQEVIQYGNTYCVGDWRCPSGTAVGLNMASWIIAFKKGKKFTPSPLHDQRVYQGGIDGSIFYVNTQWMPMCVAPALNVKYTNLS